VPGPTQATNGTSLPDDVLGDIVRVEVTRVCSGASQYSVTFNNWYTSTAQDRAAPGQAGSAPRSREQLSSGNKPLWPRFKYNDFDILYFGQRLRIDMRYWPDLAGAQPATPAGQAQSWVPMVCGPVTDMRFEFSPGGGAQLTIVGEDDLSTLKDHYPTRKEFAKAPERQIIREVLQLAHFPLTDIATPLRQWPAFADDGGDGIVESILDGQSYLQFLQKIADRLDFEVFLEFADLTDRNSALELHIEPSRARVGPGVSVSGDPPESSECNSSFKIDGSAVAVTRVGSFRSRLRPLTVACDG